MGCGSSTQLTADGVLPAQPKPSVAEPTESALEAGYAQHRGIVSVVVKGAALLVGASGLPGAAVVAGLMSEVIDAANKATDNRKNCGQLVMLVQACDKGLSMITGKSTALLEESSQQLKMLRTALEDVRQLVKLFGQGRGMLVRLIMASQDEAEFARCHKALADAMNALSLVVSLSLAASLPEVQYTEEAPGKLVQAVCKLGGSDDWKLAFSRLQEQGRMLELREFMSPEDQLLLVVVKQLTVQEIKDMHSVAKTTKLPALAKFMQDFWRKSVTRQDRATTTKFLSGLEQWMVDNGHAEQLDRFDADLRDDGLLPHASTDPDTPQSLQLQHSPVFLRHVLLPIIDDNRDNFVTTVEMVQLQLTAAEYAVRCRFDPPADLPEVLEAVYMGFDHALLVERMAIVSSEEVKGVVAGLQAEEIIRSYRTADLLAAFVPGSREWLYKRVTEWLDAVAPMPTAAAPGLPELDAQSRMFMLLGEAGMGKSVFSAVVKNKLMVRSTAGRGMVTAQHFFKVGQARGQAKAMVLCLAHQLAERLQGMAALLEPVVAEHGAGGALSMLQAFEKYLLEPLLALSKQDSPPPAVLLLLDALDEADDAGRGWLPVAALVAKDFGRLPPFVRIVLTSRPEASQDAVPSAASGGQMLVADMFKAWTPVKIEPNSKENQEDVELVLRYRLQEGCMVQDADLSAAVALMQRKSQGQFVWLKFAFEQLSQHEGPWLFGELAVVLLDGLYGTYRFLMGRVRNALLAGTAEQRGLWDALHERLLPVLLVARDALTVPQLAWLAGVALETAAQGVELLSSLFPCTPGGGDGPERILPYHKSVLDWLGSEEDAGPELAASREQGHRLCAAACLGLAMGLEPGLQKAPDNAVPVEDTMQERYTLAHAVVHLVAARDDACIDRVVLQFGFWQHAYTAGVGPGVFRDLLMHRTLSPVVKDVTRWLRTCSAFLAQYPQATMQLAVDAPSNSLVAKAAAALPCQPPARLLTKEADWPALLAAFLGHTSQVSYVAITPDGKTVVSASDDKTLRVWDAESGEVKGVLEGHIEKVTSVVCSSDGKTIVSGSIDRTVRVWDMLTGQQKSVLKGHGDAVHSVAISPDGKTIVSGSGECERDSNNDRSVRVWDMLTGQQTSVLQGHSDRVTSVAISPDGKTIVSGSLDKTVRVWDMLTGQQKSVLQGHSDRVTSVAISSDGTTIVSGSDDRTVRVWDMLTGQQKSVLEGHTAYVTSVAISPDGKTIVSGSYDKTVRVWDMLTGQQKSVLKGHTIYVRSVAISPDGTTIVSGSDDKTVRVWDTLTGQQKSVLEGHTEWVSSVAISPDGNSIVSGSGDNTVRVWDMLTGQQKSVLKGHTGTVFFSVAISPDGKTIVSGSSDMTVRVWDMLTGQQKSVLEGHTHYVRSVAISPDGTTIVSGSHDKTVRVWGMEDGKEKEVHRGEDAQSKFKTAKMWGKSAADQMLVTKSSDGNGQVVDLFSSSADKSIATVYITPPFQLDTSTMFAAGASRRLAAFTKDNKFLCYELVSFGLEA